MIIAIEVAFLFMGAGVVWWLLSAAKDALYWDEYAMAVFLLLSGIGLSAAVVAAMMFVWSL